MSYETADQNTVEKSLETMLRWAATPFNILTEISRVLEEMEKPQFSWRKRPFFTLIILGTLLAGCANYDPAQPNHGMPAKLYEQTMRAEASMPNPTEETGQQWEQDAYPDRAAEDLAQEQQNEGLSEPVTIQKNEGAWSALVRAGYTADLLANSYIFIDHVSGEQSGPLTLSQLLAENPHVVVGDRVRATRQIVPNY